MNKFFFITEGQEPDVNCIEPCNCGGRPNESIMIGSASCQECIFCMGWDSEEQWVKCLKMQNNTKYTDEEMKNVTATAMQNFWHSVAEEFSDIKTGDFPPDLTIEFESICQKMVKHWVEINK